MKMKILHSFEKKRKYYEPRMSTQHVPDHLTMYRSKRKLLSYMQILSNYSTYYPLRKKNKKQLKAYFI